MWKDYRDIKKVMNLWGESEGNAYIWKYDVRRVFVRCNRCNNDMNMGHIVWYYYGEWGGKTTTICRNCILNMYRKHPDMLEEIIMNITYSNTIIERDNAYDLHRTMEGKKTYKEMYGVSKKEFDKEYKKQEASKTEDMQDQIEDKYKGATIDKDKFKNWNKT